VEPIVEGAVRKAGSAVRVSVQLLDAATGTRLWAEAYDRDLAGPGIFKVQDEIARRSPPPTTRASSTAT